MRYCLILILLTVGTRVSAQSSRDLHTTLQRAIAARPAYVAAKQDELSSLLRSKDTLQGRMQFYTLNEKLARAYIKFKVDSAAWYLEQNLAITHDIHRNDLTAHTGIILVDCYSLLGKFREAQQLLDSIWPEELAAPERASYYQAYRNYLDYYTINDNVSYAVDLARYRDSALSLQDTTSVTYQTASAEKLLDQGDAETAKRRLLLLLKKLPPGNESYAPTTYLLGNTYTRLHDQANAKKYFTLSAIADMKNATKDNASLQKLATIYYSEGNLEMANELTKCALEDAVFSSVRFRMFQVAKFSEEITTAYQLKQYRHKWQLQLLVALITALAILVGFIAIVIWRQKSKVEQAGIALALLNKKLAESNRIKEAYISNFFEWCSGYIDKISQYRKKLLKKAIGKQGDVLISVLKSDELEKQELKELYRTFDTVFLSIYPDFVSAFNALVVPGELPSPKPGEILSPMMRVFALVRLGITDSAKIAAFLRYSPSTVYNYRTKGRNMAAGKRENFEASIMRIGEPV